MNNVYNSIMEGLVEAINDAQSSKKKLKRREVFWRRCFKTGTRKKDAKGVHIY